MAMNFPFFCDSQSSATGPKSRCRLGVSELIEPPFGGTLKLREWAKLRGISYQTAWRMWRYRRLPVPAEQLATGTAIIHQPTNPINPVHGVALYARVSSSAQKADLDRQITRLTEFAISQQFSIIGTVKEVGSGLDGHRKGMMRLLENPAARMIVVEHRHRLMRFGFEYVESALAAQNRKVVAIESDEMTDDMVRELHDVMVSMCAKLHGKRFAKNRAQRALDALINK